MCNLPIGWAILAIAARFCLRFGQCVLIILCDVVALSAFVLNVAWVVLLKAGAIKRCAILYAGPVVAFLSNWCAF